MVTKRGVVLRGTLARKVSQALIRDATTQLKTNGIPFPEWVQEVALALRDVSDQPLPDYLMSAIGHAPATLDSVEWITVKQASGRSGKSERHIRRLAASGRVQRRRVGNRSWLIDPESLMNVLRRTA